MREQKAVIYITKGEHLYVFRHADLQPGPQVPKGSIQTGETPRQATVREAYEESGFRFEHLHFLGEVEMSDAPWYDEHWHVFWAEAPEGRPGPSSIKPPVKARIGARSFFLLAHPLALPTLDWNMGILLHRIPGKTTSESVAPEEAL